MSARESLPNIKQLPFAFLTSAASALGGAVIAVASSWWGGLITQGELDAQISKLATIQKVDEADNVVHAEIDSKLGLYPRDPEKQPRPVLERLRDLEDAKTAQTEALTLAVREIVGLRVAYWLSLQGSTARERKAADDAATVARLRFDALVLGGMSANAAKEKVLEERRVPR